jgi:hypothetical protein
MNLRRFVFPIALLCSVSSGMMLSHQASAQDPFGDQKPNAAAVNPNRVPLFDEADAGTHPSQLKVGRSAMTPQEMRTARAIYRANQRVARLEHNLWIGHEPLRPRWNAVPMMSSRYGNPKFYVPVYIYNR